MAVNKRKILEAARKHAQKGSRDRALKEYEKLLRLDPRDAKLRLEIGDAYRRWGRTDDAVAAYTKVAEQYMKEGFDARAVAVYKQTQNLDPERYSICEPLAELYQRMGLMSEAVNALQTAADGYHRDGKKREALELLRKMASIDPSNTTSRIKVADLLRQEELYEEAVLEYDEVAQELIRQGEAEAGGAMFERIIEIKPDRVETLTLLARSLLERGSTERAELYARRALEVQSDAPEHYELLAEIYQSEQRDDALTDVYRRLADLYDRRGDEDRAREIRQRFVPPDVFSLEPDSPDDALEETLLEQVAEEASPPPEAEAELVEEELLEEEILGGGSPLEEDLEGVESAAGDASAAALDPTSVPSDPSSPSGVPDEESVTAPDPDADPEQLLAEASVYLRYGKRAQAIANLEAVLSREPRHRGALEKLGEAFVDGGEDQRAVESWLRAAEAAGEEGDREACEVLRDRIAALDLAAAAALDAERSGTSARASAAALDPPVSPGSTEEDEETLLEGAVADQESAPLSELELEEVEIEIDTSGLEEEAPAPGEDAGAAEAEVTAVGTASADADSVEEMASSDASASSSTSQQVMEDLEEAEFYTQQGLTDEAEAIYQRLLSIAPNHPLVQVRLGEIAAARGEDPGSTGAGLVSPIPPSEDDLAPDDAPLEVELPVPDELLADELGEVPDLDPEAGEAVAEKAPPSPIAEDTAQILERGTDAAVAPAESSFDLAAELSEAFEEEDPGSTSGGLGDTGDGIAAIFSEFKKGVSETLSEGDHEAHYDLGIAYREMGLLDDAVTEFTAAAASPARRIDCLHMLGLCALDRERPQEAIEHLRQALSTPDIAQEQQLAVHFGLGRAFESAGDREGAREAYRAVVAVDPSFCEVEERLQALADPEKPEEDRGGGSDGAGDAGEFESFEDVIAEVDAESLAEESSESTRKGAGDVPAAEAPPRRRKPKKISFV